MSRSQILERGLRQMECVAGWSCGFGTYSPIQFPVITKALAEIRFAAGSLFKAQGLERQWHSLTKE